MMNATKLMAGLFAGAALWLAGPALADVKAGVDAWSRGDYQGAVKQWQAPAAAGDPDAQFNLGNAYRLGMGVPQDRARAEDLLSRAAAQGHLEAADLYGLILFDKGERQRALPYVRAAADRGDPRAQYLIGIAHFNGDLVPKDWTRAYALVSLAVQAGTVPMAASARSQMDQYLPLEQRQQAIALATEIAAETEATRQRQLAALDLGGTVPTAGGPTPPPVLRKPPVATRSPPSIPAAQDAVAVAAQVAGGDSPRTAGADFARPAGAPARPPVVAPPVQPRPASVVTAQPPAPSAAGGDWKVQLGAFGVVANADAMWNRVKGRPEISGHPRINARAGAVTKLQAGGYASQAAAQAACGKLQAAGFTCIAVRS